jgi:MoaA/NifB/PqqE/SkfB family radical SAM enzyme
MSFRQVQETLSYFKRLGSKELVLVGGEPVLHPDLPKIINYARLDGYKRITIDTNGFDSHLVTTRIESTMLNRVRVSLDGATAMTHDCIRGLGSFDRTIAGILDYCAHGFNVDITATITQLNVNELRELIALCDELGVKSLNLHSLSMEGFGSDKQDWVVDPETWTCAIKDACRIAKTSTVKIIYPPTWVKRSQLEMLSRHGFCGCIGTKLDRVSVFSDGRVQVCTPMLGHSEPFGWMTDRGLCTSKKANEYEEFLNAKASAVSSLLSGCPAQKYEQINVSDNWIAVCRLWRIEASKHIE